jgi:hypothetical protein
MVVLLLRSIPFDRIGVTKAYDKDSSDDNSNTTQQYMLLDACIDKLINKFLGIFWFRQT